MQAKKPKAGPETLDCEMPWKHRPCLYPVVLSFESSHAGTRWDGQELP